MLVLYRTFDLLRFLAPDAVESIWNAHVNNTIVLNRYAQSMRALAEHHWAEKAHGQTRLTWCYETIKEYFLSDPVNGLQRRYARDKRKQILTDVCSVCLSRISFVFKFEFVRLIVDISVCFSSRQGISKPRVLDVG
jgi:hypothetical protein